MLHTVFVLYILLIPSIIESVCIKSKFRSWRNKLVQVNICLFKTVWEVPAFLPHHRHLLRLHLRLELLQLLQLDQRVLHLLPPAPHQQVGEEGEEEADHTADDDGDPVLRVQEADTAPDKDTKVVDEGGEEGTKWLLSVDSVGQADSHVHSPDEKAEDGHEADGCLWR